MILPPSIDRRLQDAYDPPLSEADLSALEDDLQAELPSSLRQLLIEHNGGYCRHWVAFPVENANWEVSGGFLKTLHGLTGDSDDSEADVREIAAYFWRRKGLPPWLLPFASSFCDPVCIATSGSRRGSVIMWDVEGGPPEDNLYRVASSFDDFISLLVTDDDGVFFSEQLPVLQDVEHGRIEAVNDFLADGGNVDCRNADGHTLLMCAARTSWPDILHLLLSRGASLGAVDSDGRGPLFYAVFNNSVDCVKLLLSAGADPNIRDVYGASLLDVAIKDDRARIARLLRERGARAD